MTNWIGCEYTIPPQTGIDATYANVGSGTGREIDVSISDDLTYTLHNLSGCGSPGTYNTGTWNASSRRLS